jgi:hypothetical protein
MPGGALGGLICKERKRRVNQDYNLLGVRFGGLSCRFSISKPNFRRPVTMVELGSMPWFEGVQRCSRKL